MKAWNLRLSMEEFYKTSNRDIQREENQEATKAKNAQNRPHSSGFRTFLNWFKKVEKLQVENANQYNDNNSEYSSISSDSSTATVASFAFLHPKLYKPYGDAIQPEKFISAGPYTETYNRLILERNQRRNIDKNLCISKKYHLYTSGTINQNLSINNNNIRVEDKEHVTFSLPTRKRTNLINKEIYKEHRRTFSDSSTYMKSESFVHVKGKRKAPQPPLNANSLNRTYRKKRTAPAPPHLNEKIKPNTETSIKMVEKNNIKKNESTNINPRPWYKRQFNDNKFPKVKNNTTNAQNDQTELPEISFFRCPKFLENKRNIIFDKNHEKTEPKGKRISMLSNISELDREATEIINMKRKKAQDQTLNQSENVPGLMTTKDLITKFNNMNDLNAKTVIVNCSKKAPQIKNNNIDSKTELLEKEENIDIVASASTKSSISNSIFDANKCNLIPKIWRCSKCYETNQYVRLFCNSCNHIRPLSKPDYLKGSNLHEPSNLEEKKFYKTNQHTTGNYNANITNQKLNKEESFDDKQKLKELLKEMKNSLPKRSKISQPISDNSNISTPVLHKKHMMSENSPVQNKIFKPEHRIHKNKLNIENKVGNDSTENVDIDIKHVEDAKLPSKSEDISPKTSSSVQTNAVLKKINYQYDIHGKTSISKNATINELYTNIEEIKPSQSNNKSSMAKANVKSNGKELYKRLENAIAEGDDKTAAEIAKKLALLKVHCVVFGPTETIKPENNIIVDVYVEDQETHQGPIPLKLRCDMTIAELKMFAFREMNIPINVQRWIVGKQLAADDDRSLSFYSDNLSENPLFLYVAATEKNTEEKNNTTENDALQEPALTESKYTQIKTILGEEGIKTQSQSIEPTECPSTDKETLCAETNHYQELMKLDDQDLVKNVEVFECSICLTECGSDAGIVLRDCLHTFCKDCLANTIRYCDEAEVKCPYIDNQYSCESVLQEREIKALVVKTIYEQHLAKSVSVAQNKMEKTFHCKTPDCNGWCIYEDYVNEFKCPVCNKLNCLTCQAIHSGLNCRQYQEILKIGVGTSSDAAGGLQTKQMLDEMICKGEAMLCPCCQIVLMKKWGCDWLRCSMCKTEICWVTRGPRWGPAGKGDITGGCLCGVNGIKCHPKCNYCH